MKIFQIISSLGNGGAEKLLIELSNELKNNGHEVIIVSLKNTSKEMIFLKNIDPKIKIITLNKNKGFSIKTYYNLLKNILLYKPSIIHFHLDSTFKYIFPFTLFYKKIKFVYTIHSKLSNNNQKKFNTLNKYFSWVKNITYICITKNILEDFSANFKKLKFKKVENGISLLKKSEEINKTKKEIESYKKNHKTKVGIIVGKVVPVKNYKLLIDSMEKLKNENFICIVIGNTEVISQKYFDGINKNNTGNVHFIGVKKNVVDYLLVSDVFLMTSLNEGLPISALEALSHGKPIITTPAGGMKDLIQNDSNGFITKGFETNEYYETIKIFLNSNEEKIEMIRAENLRKFEENFTIKHCFSKYIKIYN